MEDSLAYSELTHFCQQFEEAEEATREAREKAERDRDYYDEKQWTSAEKATLEKRGQPAITYNRIKRKVNAMLGLEKQTRKDPKAFPRNPQDAKAADAVTDALRYVCEDSRWDDKRSLAAKELAIEGTGIIMVGFKQHKGGLDPEIRRVAWDRFYHDPHSSEFDFSDASYMGVVIWMDYEKAVRKFPEAKDILTATWMSGRTTETYDDKPKNHLWSDYKRRRVRICEHYYNEGDGWKFCLFTKGGFIIEPQASPYMDDEGKPECPLKAVSLYVDRDNNRYGEVRTMIGAQDEINHRRSRALHLINQRQVRISPTLGLDAEAVRRELSKPNGVLVGDMGEVEILPTNDMAAANLNLLQEAKAEIDLQGPNAALGGKNEAAMSGRALLAQQQGGMVELATYLDTIRVLSIQVYRSVWGRVRQAWNEERWIRVTDNENNLKFVGLNRPVTAIQDMAQELGITKENLPQMQQQAPEVVQELQMIAQSPMAQQVVRIENNVAELDVDILVDEGIDTPTIAAEEFDAMLKLAGTGVVAFPPDVLIEASSLRNKEKLLDMLKQPPSEEQMMAGQLQMAAAQADVEKVQSETAENMAQTQKIMADIQLGAFNAGVGMAA